jgi:glycosyltransferase involved in cell wall biosynthesis
MSVRVLYIMPPTRTYAGIERVVDEICAELSSRFGDTLSISVLYTSQFQDYPITDRPYGTIHTLPNGRWELLAAIRRAVREQPYDVVVVPQVEATVICWLACLGLKRKWVCYLHGNPRLETRSAKAKLLFYLMDKVVLQRLAGVFGTSPKQLAAFKDMYPSHVEHRWVPNPVRRFDRPEPDEAPPGSEVTFVNVGRFSYQKGQDILLEAFAKLHRARPGARLRIVGYGPEEDDLRRTIERLGVGSVAWIEHHPNNPEAALASSDVYVSTSRWEGWSLAICEALRFGLPVVSTDCEFGPSDILTDKRLGRLTPNGDVERLVEAMIHYYDNLAAERAHADFRRAYVETFSVEQVAPIHADALTRAFALAR